MESYYEELEEVDDTEQDDWWELVREDRAMQFAAEVAE